MSLLFVGDWLPKDTRHVTFPPNQLVIGNLECAFADSEIDGGKAYTSVLPKEAIKNVVCAGFAALSLANNHAYDAGTESFVWAHDELAQREVRLFGTGDTPCVDLFDGGNSIAVIGCLEPCRSRGAKIFRQEDVEDIILSIRRSYQRVYVYPHWGKEGEYTRWPSPAQRRLSRHWIDLGADGVFGSHSHVFQGRETYKGKPIYYSLGNFCFDQPEGKQYSGTDKGLAVVIEPDGQIHELIKTLNGDLRELDSEEKRLLDDISSQLLSWTTWTWAKAIGPFYLSKNSASWTIRLKKHFWRTLPKYLIWQVLPKTILFRIASFWR